MLHNLCWKGWYHQHSHYLCGNSISHKACRNGILMLPGQILKTLLLKWEKCYWDKFYKDKCCLDQWHWDWSVKENSRYLTLSFFLNYVCNFLFWQGWKKVARTNVAWANITFTVVYCLGGPWKTTPLNVVKIRWVTVEILPTLSLCGGGWWWVVD